MIKISTRYIGWTVCKMILLILFIFAALQFVLQFVGDLSHVGHGQYTLARAMYCIVLALPMQLYSLFSVIAFLGTILSLGMLVQRNELVVFRASGLSVHRLLSIILRAVFILVLLVTCLGEWIAPGMNKLSVELKQQALNTHQVVSHYWWRNQNRFYFIRSTDGHDHINGLVSLALPESGGVASMGYSAVASKEEKNWLAPNQSVSQLNNDISQTFMRHNVKIPAKLHINSSQIARHAVDEESLSSLARVIREKKEEGRAVGRFQVAYWSRLLQPLATLILVFLGVPIVFTQVRRSTGSFRLLVGIAIGFAFYLSNQLLAPVGVLMGWPPAVVVLLPIVIFFSWGLYLMRRVS